MKTNVVKNRINRIFIGAILWGMFYLNVFYDDYIWNNTLLGELFSNSYSYEVIYAIKVIFFIAVSINLYMTTVGKGKGIINFSKILNIIIFTSFVVLITQWYLIVNNIEFHFGAIGYFFGNPSYSHLLDSTNVFVFGLYLVGNIFEYIFIAGLFVYLYQLYKMNQTLDFMYYLRIGIILLIYVFCLGNTIYGFDPMTMLLSLGYILCGVLVYIKSKYSLASMYLSIVLLLLI